MTRIAIVIAVLCALAGAIYSSWDSYQKKAAEVARLERAAGPYYLYAKRDLMVGAVIREDDITVIRPIKKISGPTKDAFLESQKVSVVGRRAKYGFSAGQLITAAKLSPQ